MSRLYDSSDYSPIGIVVFSHGGNRRRSLSPFSFFNLPSNSLTRSSLLCLGFWMKSWKFGPFSSLSRIFSTAAEVCLSLNWWTDDLLIFRNIFRGSKWKRFKTKILNRLKKGLFSSKKPCHHGIPYLSHRHCFFTCCTTLVCCDFEINNFTNDIWREQCRKSKHLR